MMVVGTAVRCHPAIARSRRYVSTSAPPPHSVYLAKIRRAFLLRVHPDRFRATQSQDDTNSSRFQLQRQQHKLVQALQERLSLPDVALYSVGKQPQHAATSHASSSIRTTPYPYVLEHKDGSLQQHILSLHDDIPSLLHDMKTALKSTGHGLALPPAPPPPVLQPTESPQQGSDRHTNTVHWAKYDPSTGRGTIDSQYDIHTRQGRDLLSFLRSANAAMNKTIQERRSHRMDAVAATLVCRRLFHFRSMDGTNISWSSESYTQLVRSLTALYHEHAETHFSVSSFYPLQLQWSHEEFTIQKQSRHERNMERTAAGIGEGPSMLDSTNMTPLDTYGGVLYLNPGRTPIQWLDDLQLVTRKTLQQVQDNQMRLQEYSSQLQDSLSIKLQKGHSCGHREYHDCLKGMASQIETHERDGVSSSSALSLDRLVVVVVEAANVCRRPEVTREGHVRVGATHIDWNSMKSAIAKYAIESTRRAQQEQEMLSQCRHATDRAYSELGLQAVKKSTKWVQTPQMLDCLLRLLALQEDNEELLKARLAGQALGIASSGQFCHISDDGSLVIPWDWT